MNTRRDFLLASAVAASLTAVACSSQQQSSGTPSSSPVPPGEGPSLQFDLNHFNQLIGKNVAHRNSFGIARVEGGEGLYAMNNVYTTYDRVLNVPVDQVLLAGVLYRGASITMAFNDDVWNDVIIPALPRLNPELRADFESVRITTGNPFLYRPPNGNGKDASVESLVARGALLFVCDNATFQLALMIASALKQRVQEVYQAFTGSLVPGTTLVPTGVWAIGALQEAHFTYLQAAL